MLQNRKRSFRRSCDRRAQIFNMKTEKPILFSAPMVRAILENRKTQTRRIVKAMIAPHVKAITGLRDYGPKIGFGFVGKVAGSDDLLFTPCPYPVGTRLWVRETTHRRPMLNPITGDPLNEKYDGGAYSADNEYVLDAHGFDFAWWYKRKVCPSIHMPRWASRITLEVTKVRVERLQGITEEDAVEEGVEPMSHGYRDYLGRDFQCDAVTSFNSLWQSINGPDSWNANPFVWAYDFRRVEA